MSDNTFNCSVCKLKHRGSAERQEKKFKQKHCKETSINKVLAYSPMHEMAGATKIAYYTCPANLQDGAAAGLIGVYANYSNGILP